MGANPKNRPDRHTGASFALLTKHGKERAIAPRFRSALGAEVVLVDSFDTDTLGTFTRDVPRAGSQWDAARRKAELAIELSGLPRGLGSEGSFSAGPFGFVATNLELLVLKDAELGIEVAGVAVAGGHQASGIFSDWERFAEFARKMLFPSHGLVLRPGDGDDPRIYKDAGDFEKLRAVFSECTALSPEGLVFAESDLRAHRNPTRMETIGQACGDLLRRLQCDCPACGKPGFGLAKKLSGLPCSWCGSPTNDILGEEHKCPACGFTETRDTAEGKKADPKFCPACNP
ncbi:MAG: hypothetical protein KGR46_00175 [Verrucomicrobia bacterium]|nr:hypothetical protein [Verrucomicrobiota bacterium]